jgi:biotin-(acetyl-CoA carboxylase) ligase
LTVETLESCPSTAAYLEEIAKHEGLDGYVVISDRVATPAATLPPEREGECTLHVSILLRPSLSPSRGVMLSALASLALAKAVKAHSTYTPRIRWVSDVYGDKRRVAGVTMRAALHPSGAGYLYIIVNLALRITKEFAGTLPDIVESVFSSRRTTLTERIATTLVTDFFALYEAMATDEQGKGMLEEYRALSLLQGKRIRILRDGKRRTGTVIGIDDNARLVVALRRGGSTVLHSVAEIYVKRRKHTK